MAPGRLTLPNLITIGRILSCPAVFALVLIPSVTGRILSFILFLAAAFSDLWDGYLARKHGLVTDLGKLLDPLADKLLLAATFIPIFVLSHGEGWAFGPLPWWGPLPVWVVLLIFGRELAVTLFRVWAARKGVVISADYLPAGTYVYTYIVRAGTPGRFNIIPPTAQEFYFPEVYGRGAGGQFEVRP